MPARHRRGNGSRGVTVGCAKTGCSCQQGRRRCAARDRQDCLSLAGWEAGPIFRVSHRLERLRSRAQITSVGPGPGPPEPQPHPCGRGSVRGRLGSLSHRAGPLCCAFIGGRSQNPVLQEPVIRDWVASQKFMAEFQRRPTAPSKVTPPRRAMRRHNAGPRADFHHYSCPAGAWWLADTRGSITSMRSCPGVVGGSGL